MYHIQGFSHRPLLIAVRGGLFFCGSWSVPAWFKVGSRWFDHQEPLKMQENQGFSGSKFLVLSSTTIYSFILLFLMYYIRNFFLFSKIYRNKDFTLNCKNRLQKMPYLQGFQAVLGVVLAVLGQANFPLNSTTFPMMVTGLSRISSLSKYIGA